MTNVGISHIVARPWEEDVAIQAFLSWHTVSVQKAVTIYKPNKTEQNKIKIKTNSGNFLNRIF